jgi:ribonuclease-3
MSYGRNSIEEFEGLLGYKFNDRTVLLTALSHSSYGNELGLASNERLEFLGDAVLHLVLTEHIMKLYPDAGEGLLSFLRSCTESEEFLYKAALEIDLGSFIFLGKGEEKSGGRGKKAILADAVEAVIAAISVDGGYPSAKEFILGKFKNLLTETYKTALHSDSKSELQQLVQKRYGILPSYLITGEEGLDHDKTFMAEARIVTAAGEFVSAGSGKNKKEAEKAAAQNLLKKLNESD